ncbi:MAG: A24 family peptidase, partial [Phycisphaerales bacterium]|nr:A24 family peptidase [Phycisphaerales bacterium]
MHPVIPLFPLLVGLLVAAIVDLRSRRIPNSLTVTLALAGIAQSVLWEYALVSWWQSLLGIAIALAVNLPLYALRVRGGGDVKLFAAVGAWIGPVSVVAIFVIATVVASVVAILQALATGQLRAVARNVARLSVGLV